MAAVYSDFRPWPTLHLLRLLYRGRLSRTTDEPFALFLPRWTSPLPSGER
jgi:hypothetical protein